MNNQEQMEKFHTRMLLNSSYGFTTPSSGMDKFFELYNLEKANQITEEGIKQLLALRKAMKTADYNTEPLTNEITINSDEIINLPDNSIIDCETIRQIALYGIKNNDNSLNNKIKKGYEFCGLYPHVMEIYNIQPELPIK